jgi:putative hydrolase of the HAD superfamily
MTVSPLAAGGAGEASLVADLSGVDTWLFDLDHTLYPPTTPVLRRIEARIRDYMVELTGLPPDEAWALQKDYLARYGGAAPGLIAHHGVDIPAFLAHIHDVPIDEVEPEPALKAALARLPGRRLVFTNASARHAERLLEKLEIADFFEAVFHTEAAGMLMKPDPRAFAALIDAHAVAPRSTAFFEDRADNLAPAAALGMTTVLVGPHAVDDAHPFVHHRTNLLAPFLASAQVMETP